MKKIDEKRLIGLAKNCRDHDVRSMASELLSFRNCHGAIKKEGMETYRENISRCEINSKVMRALILDLASSKIINPEAANELIKGLV